MSAILEIMASTHRAPARLRFAAVAVDAVCLRVHEGVLEVLLGAVHRPPHYTRRQGLIGGLILEHETAEAALARHLTEKVGLSMKHLHGEQLATYSALNRDPRNRVVSVAYLCFVPPGAAGEGGALETQWVPLARAKHLAYDHDAILKDALARLRSKLGYTNLARFFMPQTFAFSELQQAYEAVLGRPLDKRNFRKRFLSLGLVRATGKKRKTGATRPAELYAFTGKGVRVLEL